MQRKEEYGFPFVLQRGEGKSFRSGDGIHYGCCFVDWRLVVEMGMLDYGFDSKSRASENVREEACVMS